MHPSDFPEADSSLFCSALKPNFRKSTARHPRHVTGLSAKPSQLNLPPAIQHQLNNIELLTVESLSLINFSSEVDASQELMLMREAVESQQGRISEVKEGRCSSPAEGIPYRNLYQHTPS
jgi:hypothetical protein